MDEFQQIAESLQNQHRIAAKQMIGLATRVQKELLGDDQITAYRIEGMKRVIAASVMDFLASDPRRFIPVLKWEEFEESHELWIQNVMEHRLSCVMWLANPDDCEIDEGALCDEWLKSGASMIKTPDREYERVEIHGTVGWRRTA